LDRSREHADWASVACSADGSQLVAVARGGRIYTSAASTTEGDTGSLVGRQGSAVELQYVGNGRFFPLSHAGTFEVY